MTCIVGMVAGDYVVIAGDSCGGSASTWSTLVVAGAKVFRNGDYVIGYSGEFRHGQLLGNASLPVHTGHHDDFPSFLAGELADAFRNVFRAGGWLQKDKEREYGGVFLLGWRNRLFCVQHDFDFFEPRRGFHAIGCGDDAAIGATQALLNDGRKLGTQLAMDVLAAVESVSGGVLYPFHAVSTDGTFYLRACARGQQGNEHA